MHGEVHSKRASVIEDIRLADTQLTACGYTPDRLTHNEFLLPKEKCTLASRPKANTVSYGFRHRAVGMCTGQHKDRHRIGNGY